MDSTTENVTIFAMLINDVIRQFEDRRADYQPLFDLVREHDLSDPYNQVPITLYNNVCAWIGENMGRYSLIRTGRYVGESIYATLKQEGRINGRATPHAMAEALKKATNTMVQDPKKRGWDILESSAYRLTLRLTQNLNSQLQLGLLEVLIRKAGVYQVKVKYLEQVAKGDRYDVYEVTWK